jgi:hypothetical protein
VSTPAERSGQPAHSEEAVIPGLEVSLWEQMQGQRQRPRRDLDSDGRLGCALHIAVLVDGQVGVTADDGQAEDAGGRLVVLVVPPPLALIVMSRIMPSLSGRRTSQRMVVQA